MEKETEIPSIEKATVISSTENEWKYQIWKKKWKYQVWKAEGGRWQGKDVGEAIELVEMADGQLEILKLESHLLYMPV